MRSVSEPAEGVPAFLAKLWKLVDESRSNHLIAWAKEGNSFVIKNQIDFARKLLPLYYKHNNMASFIRQLNMYGFHKVVSVENGSLKCENDEIQFSHPCFLKGHPFLLPHIKRKIANPKNSTTNNEEKALLKPELMTKVLTDVKQMKGRQESLDTRFSVMKHENEALWREVALLRQKHIKQQQIVNNLIQFLMSLVQPSRSGPLKTGVKRRYQLMINDAAHNIADSRAHKSPRVDSDDEMDEESELGLPEMLDFEGPIIHEVGEQEHGENVENNTMMTETDPHFIQSPVGTSSTAPSPAASSIANAPDAFDIGSDNIDDSPLQNSPMELRSTSASPKLTSSKLRKKIVDNESNVNNTRRQKSSSPAFSITQASATLPTNIFDSDETNSQDDGALSLSDIDQQAVMSAIQQNAGAYLDVNSAIDDDYISNVVSGNYNPNLNLNNANVTKGKNKLKKSTSKDDLLRNIKEEVLLPEDDSNVDNMTLAKLPNENVRPSLSRFNSVTLRDYTTQQNFERKMKKQLGSAYKNNEDVDDHLISMQNDIESLREMLCGDSYSLDANPLLGLFHDDPLYGLSLNNQDLALDKPKDSVDESTSQLISYVPPPSFGFDDFELDDDLNGGTVEERPVTPENDSLNTPQVQLSEPNFPIDSID